MHLRHLPFHVNLVHITPPLRPRNALRKPPCFVPGPHPPPTPVDDTTRAPAAPRPALLPTASRFVCTPRARLSNSRSATKASLSLRVASPHSTPPPRPAPLRPRPAPPRFAHAPPRPASPTPRPPLRTPHLPRIVATSPVKPPQPRPRSTPAPADAAPRTALSPRRAPAAPPVRKPAHALHLAPPAPREYHLLRPASSTLRPDWEYVKRRASNDGRRAMHFESTELVIFALATFRSFVRRLRVRVRL
ncbi:hypothetical protein B0H17DRAFT_1337067 [Mycena rosella]|uniref:Uncharacterized protein n=1 Tax=Mycena rosella TaxID=1033263 RepID=A0AAD7CT22_MYCRO|nr:hypothetical protein B0H17DRAFT_1337067 [Mycena rosella]